jgi:hypothetical protein
MQIAAQLQVVGRVGEDHVDAFFRQAAHNVYAFARENLIYRK